MEGVEELIHQATDPLAPLEERQRAFGEIVNHFQDMAYGRAYAMLHDFHLSQDAAQEAFIEAWRNLDTLKDPKAFPGWLKRIVIRRCSRLTRRKAFVTTPIEDAYAVASDQPEPHIAVEKAEIKEIVHKAIKALSEPERTTTTLFYIDGYTQNQIADFLEVPVTTVNMRLHRSRKHLKEKMVTMVQDTLQQQRPSRDEKFVKAVLFKAIESADAEKVSQLLNENPTLISAKDDKDRTPIEIFGRTQHIVAMVRKFEPRRSIYNLLMARGATPDLVAAIAANDVAGVQLLIEGGANLKQKYTVDINGKILELTPREYARKLAALYPDEPYTKVIDVLRKHSASK